MIMRHSSRLTAYRRLTFMDKQKRVKLLFSYYADIFPKLRINSINTIIKQKKLQISQPPPQEFKTNFNA